MSTLATAHPLEVDFCSIDKLSGRTSQFFDWKIGRFGDKRLQDVGVKFLRSIVERGTLVVNRIATCRAEQVQFERFLWNSRVTIEEMHTEALYQTALNAKNCHHVLCFQDTTEVDLSHRPNDVRPDTIGLLKNRDISGYYVHPVLAVDEKDDFVLGLASVMEFEYPRPRPKKKSWEEAKKPVEEKNSYRWIDCAMEAEKTLKDADMVTIIGDRENDFYEFFARVPRENFHILVRSKGTRTASLPVAQNCPNTMELSKLVSGLPAQARITIEVPRRGAVIVGNVKAKRSERPARRATLEVRFSLVMLHRSKISTSTDPAAIPMTVVDVREVDTCGLEGEEPIHWSLLTSHTVTNEKDALRIVGWYKRRWNIEQLFRVAKRGGMRLEEIELSKGDGIKKLGFLGLLASVRILQLTLCRDGVLNRPAEMVFEQDEIQVLQAVEHRLEGKTLPQKNPHPKQTLGWAHWILGRLGGWKGSTKHGGPAGPLSLKRGLDELAALRRGWLLSRLGDVCIT